MLAVLGCLSVSREIVGSNKKTTNILYVTCKKEIICI